MRLSSWTNPRRDGSEQLAHAGLACLDSIQHLVFVNIRILVGKMNGYENFLILHTYRVIVYPYQRLITLFEKCMYTHKNIHIIA
jgi:hypothetical protein